jgi:hypothetical protein
MAVEEITARRWTCDGCGNSVKTEADEKPEGFQRPNLPGSGPAV